MRLLVVVLAACPSSALANLAYALAVSRWATAAATAGAGTVRVVVDRAGVHAAVLNRAVLAPTSVAKDDTCTACEDSCYQSVQVR